MKMYIKCNVDGFIYKATSYYGLNFRGIEDDMYSDDYSEIQMWAWDKVLRGHTVEIVDQNSGEYKRYSPDALEYMEDAIDLSDFEV